MTDALSAAFDDFEAATAEVREMIETTERFRSYPDHRVQAYVSLAEARSMAYTMAIAPRTDVPRLHAQGSWHATTSSLGQNCQDMRYAIVLLDGARTYRLRGHLGEQRLALWQVHSHVMGHPESREIGNYDLTEIAGPDGTIDILISGQEQAQPFIKLEPGSPLNFVLVRRILNRITDDYGDLRLEEVGDGNEGTARIEEIDPGHVAERITDAAHLLRFLVRNWAIGLYEFYLKTAGGKNRFSYIPGQQIATDLAGSSSTTYGFCVFDLEPDEALIVEWDTVESAYWSWQLGDVWSNALDFINHQTTLNSDQAVVDADGKVRAVLSATDPGVPNWLDTRGRREGVVVLRNYKERSASVSPTARLVDLAALRDELPAGTPTVSPEDRAKALLARRSAYHDAYGE
ncbi:MAG TPA: DUF1214 domain-containing protein [Pseudonocardia sp.]|nr:DUF1214 domain-containing protein [Pseudonocardia sp.]